MGTNGSHLLKICALLKLNSILIQSSPLNNRVTLVPGYFDPNNQRNILTKKIPKQTIIPSGKSCKFHPIKL